MTTATKVTLIRIAFIPLLMFTLHMSVGQPGLWMYISLGIFITASITDYIDGMIARYYKQITDFGKFLDPLADKLLVITVMVMFCQWQMIPAWALMIVLTREFAVTGLRLTAVARGKVIAAAWSGKIKTASTMIGLCFWMAFPAATLLGDIVTGVIVVTTLYSGVEYFVKNWKCFLD